MAYGDEVLFSNGRLDDWLSGKESLLAATVASLPDQELSAVTSGTLADDFADRFYVEALALITDGVIADDPVDAQVDVSGEFLRAIPDRSRPHRIQGTRYQFVIPYSGNSDLLKLQPATYRQTSVLLGVDTMSRQLTLTYEAVTPTAEAATNKLQTALTHVEEHIGWQEPQIDAYNERIRATAVKAIDARRAKLANDQNVLGNLGVSVTRRTDAPRVLDVPKKRVPVRRGRSTVAGAKPANERASILGDETYEQILDTLDDMAVVMEYSPSAFRTMDEEALRTVFLVPLNIHYEISASAETFNYEGKTDIIIKHEGRNLFIAECMIWNGPASLFKKIEQLLGYASWRDTKTAIVIFNRNKNFSNVLKQISPTVQGHPHCVREIPIEGETRFRFRLTSRDDTDKHVTLTVLAFDVPS